MVYRYVVDDGPEDQASVSKKFERSNLHIVRDQDGMMVGSRYYWAHYETCGNYTPPVQALEKTHGAIYTELRAFVWERTDFYFNVSHVVSCCMEAYNAGI